MPIPAKYNGRFVYHFTHIDNLPGLIANGFLAHNHQYFPRAHRSIAYDSIQCRRAQMAVTCGPRGCVHDYVPFYFGSISPMLLAIVNAKNVDQEDILYFEFPIELIDRADVVFSGASANTDIPPMFYSDPSELDRLDWAAIDSKKWRSSPEDYKHRRMAEMLVYGQLNVTAAARCVVWNESIKARVEAIVGGNAFPSIEFQDRDRPHWFTNFAEGGRASLVKGPKAIRAEFEHCVEFVMANIGSNSDQAEFENLSDLLDGLRDDFGCLPQTAELVNLASDNCVHKRTVDAHTKAVVAGLKMLPEFDALDAHQQLLVELVD